MASTTLEGRVECLEVGRWKFGLDAPADNCNPLFVERNEALAKGLFQHDAGQILDHGEEVVAEDAVRVQGPEALEAAPGGLWDRWDEIGRCDGPLLKLSGVLGAERPSGGQTQRRKPERPLVRGRQFGECSNIHCCSMIDRPGKRAA
jgi:hypothetical protein